MSVIDYRTVIYNIFDKIQTNGRITDKQEKKLTKLEQWQRVHANMTIKKTKGVR